MVGGCSGLKMQGVFSVWLCATLSEKNGSLVVCVVFSLVVFGLEIEVMIDFDYGVFTNVAFLQSTGT